MFAGNFAPEGWAICDGRKLPIRQNQALFSLLGNAFGGDGTTDFALPDLRGRAPMHIGNGHQRAEAKGDASIAFNNSHVPLHTHPVESQTPPLLAAAPNAPTNGTIGVKCKDTAGGTLTQMPDKAYPGNASFSKNDNCYAMTRDAADYLGANATTVDVSTEGGKKPVNNMIPSLSVCFIIALKGIYPPRS